MLTAIALLAVLAFLCGMPFAAAVATTPGQRRQASLDAANAIKAQAEKDGGDLSAEQLQAIKGHLADAAAAKAEQEAEDKLAGDASAALEDLKAQTEDLGKSRGRRIGAGASTPVARQPMVAREAFLDDPARGFRNVRDQLGAILAFHQSGRLSDNLKSLRAPRDFASDMLEQEATAGSDEHGTFSDASLGFLLAPAFASGVLTREAPSDPFSGTLKIPMTTQALVLRARTDHNHSTSVSGGLRVYRRGESQQGPSSKVAIEELTLRCFSLIGVTYETEELLQDAPGAALALITKGFADEFVSRRIREILNGTGAGEFLGINNSPALVTVDKESGQAADTITYNNIVEMFARLWGSGFWVANKTCIPQLAKMNAGTQGLVWQPSAREGLPGTLLGLPIVYSEYCAAIGDVGDILLVNMGEYLEGQRQALGFDESIHVRFLELERTFRFTKRDGGMPWWRAPLTPKNGATLSPFVRLQAR